MASSSALHLQEWIQSMSRWQLREFGARAFSQDLQTVEKDLREKREAERASGEEARSVAASLGGSSQGSSALSAASLDYGDLSADECTALEQEDR